MLHPPHPVDPNPAVAGFNLRTAGKYAALIVLAIAGLAGGNIAIQRVARHFQSQQEAAELESLLADLIHALDRHDDAQTWEPATDPSAAVPVNALAPDASFVDFAGRPGALRSSRGRVLVVSMTSITCPISAKLVPALARLADEFRDRDVDFLAVNVDGDASEAELAAHAARLPGWRYVHDKEARIATALGAGTTTEAFVLDRSQTLRYRGAVDDRFAVGVTRAAANEYLRAALAAVLDGAVVSTPSTSAPGCLLTRRPAAEAPESVVTWHNQISRFVQYHCAECHRRGEAAPFALETYDQVVAKASMIEYVLDERLMPPWFADAAYGDWRNARVVPDAEKEAFRQWVAAGYPEGDPDDAPEPLARGDGWVIGEPDVVLEAPPQEVPAEGLLPWRILPLKFDLPEDVWVAAAEIRASVPSVVHHAMLFVEYAEDDPRRMTQPGGEAGKSGGATGFWSSYFPGRKAMILPPGRGKLLPRGGKISIQLHYNPDGTARVDETKVGFKLLSAPPEQAVISGGLIKWDFRVPPDSLATFVHGETLGEDIRLLALMPHMHYRGMAAQVFLQRPDGSLETLLNVPRYDFNWQVSYEFREPPLVTRGSRLIIRHTYDNRSTNLNNPDATQTLVHGDDTTDEMMINFFDWEPAGDAPPPKAGSRPFE